MPEAKDWITYVLTVISIIVTAWFSYRVLKATEATNELSKQISRAEEERQKEFKMKMRKQLIPEILNQSKTAHNATVDLDTRNINKKLKTAPKELVITNEELASYFSEEEITAIKEFWAVYSNYRKTYFKETYNGNEIELLLDNAAPVAETYSDLVNILRR
ncbi:hypothetical protein AAAC51_37175 [Priestia megaterium]